MTMNTMPMSFCQHGMSFLFVRCEVFRQSEMVRGGRGQFDAGLAVETLEFVVVGDDDVLKVNEAFFEFFHAFLSVFQTGCCFLLIYFFVRLLTQM